MDPGMLINHFYCLKTQNEGNTPVLKSKLTFVVIMFFWQFWKQCVFNLTYSFSLKIKRKTLLAYLLSHFLISYHYTIHQFVVKKSANGIRRFLCRIKSCCHVLPSFANFVRAAILTKQNTNDNQQSNYFQKYLMIFLSLNFTVISLVIKFLC